MSGDHIPARGIVKPGGNDSPPAVDESDLPYWETATRTREERPLWVVIWLARERRYRAYPKFRAPAGTTSAKRHHPRGTAG